MLNQNKLNQQPKQANLSEAEFKAIMLERRREAFKALNERLNIFSADLICLNHFSSAMITADCSSFAGFNLSEVARVQEVYIKFLDEEFSALHKTLRELIEQAEGVDLR